MILPLPQNLLADAASPYLRQHRDNPVHWRPWSRAALDEAAALQRPILLSVGYAACHWCHVMAHESFEDKAVAAVMNRLFVNIKVDREERPDIDQIYMAALNAMGEQGGWPLTMFLAPDGRPFWGGTYFPKHARYGRPGFVDVLHAVATTWNDKRGELDHSADTLMRHVATQLSPPQAAIAIDPATLLADYAASIHSLIDAQGGGLRGAPKFPNAPMMNVLRLSWLNGGPESHRDAVVESLEKMLSGGIYDHLGGGLCRYSTDERWLVPHFEKMLYDNAQLIDLCAWAHAETGNELFRYRIEETIAWLAREMRVDGGGLASSLDADSEGEEGLFYLWTKEECAALLGDDGCARFFAAYELEKPHDWEGEPILHRLSYPACGPGDSDPAILEMKARLFEARSGRIRPGRDDKILVDWNGMTISALARAGRQFARADWIELAAAAFRFVAESERDGRLPHSIFEGDSLFPGIAADYAAMIDAAVTLAQATGEVDHYHRKAAAWLAALDRWHRDEDGTGHYFTASDAMDVPVRIRGDADEAIPSSTARIVEAMTRLAMLGFDDALYRRAVSGAEAALRRTAHQRHGRAGIVHAAALAVMPRKLILVGRRDDDLVSVANRFPDPARVDVLHAVDAERTLTLPDGAAIDATEAGAWLCVGQTCLPPARTGDDLEKLLRPGR